MCSTKLTIPLFFTCSVHTSPLDFPPRISSLLCMSHTHPPWTIWVNHLPVSIISTLRTASPMTPPWFLSITLNSSSYLLLSYQASLSYHQTGVLILQPQTTPPSGYPTGQPLVQVDLAKTLIFPTYFLTSASVQTLTLKTFWTWS